MEIKGKTSFFYIYNIERVVRILLIVLLSQKGCNLFMNVILLFL